MNRQTPGPWKWDGDDLYGKDDWQVLKGDMMTPNPNDARLIAAAPDLLAALRAAEQFIYPEVDRGPAVDGWQGTIDMVNVAIAKATGMIGLLLCVLSLTACEFHKGPLAPSDSVTGLADEGGRGSGVRPLSLVIGSWYGEETATVGESGTLTVNFSQAPSVDLNVEALAVWIGATGIRGEGRIHGSLPALVIDVTFIGGPGTACGYTASAALNAEAVVFNGRAFAPNTLMRGSYHGVGQGPCSGKAGSFWLTGNSATPPPPPPPPPAPKCDVAVPPYTGPNPFVLGMAFALGNTSEELAYVRLHVSDKAEIVGSWTQPVNTFSWTADADYPVVVSMATNGTWWLYTNICKGVSFHTHVVEGPDKSIAHVTGFKVMP